MRPETDTMYPYFEISPENVEFLNEPGEFYSELKKMFSGAKKRIIISSLYLGTGRMETELVNAIDENLSRNKALTVKTLFDHSRGLRNETNSKTVFQRCIEAYPDRFKFFLYHTPKLRAGLKSLLPKRVDEIIGVMHMKVYIADDDFIITGANLSHDYFVDRQDRYLVIRNCKKLCNFYSRLFDAITEVSFRAESDGEVTFNNEDQEIHPYLGNYKGFCNRFAKNIDELYARYLASSKRLDLDDINFENDPLLQNTSKVYIVPLVQNGPADVTYDQNFMEEIVRKASANSQLNLATGYFNLTESFIEQILSGTARYRIMTTSEFGNGFYGSKGLSGNIPDIYTSIEKEFHDLIGKRQQDQRVRLYEYYKENWTFHAKGLWYVPNSSKQSLPTLTIVGSSNFGHRSVGRDLEFQLAIFSQNEQFKQKLFNEQTHVFEHSKLVTQVSKASAWIRVASRILKSYF